MSDTTDSIEREVEARRASVGATLDRIKARTSLDQLAEDASSYLHLDDARIMLRNAGEQVRQNPIAIGLVAAGLGWLMLGGAMTGGSSSQGSRTRGTGGSDDVERWQRQYAGQTGGMHGHHDDAGQGMGNVASAVSGTADSIRHGVTDTADSIRQGVTGTAQSIRQGVAGTVERTSDYVSDATHGMAETTRAMTDGVTRQVQGHPFLTGTALAVFGAVIGAALPKSTAELDLMHAPRRTILREGKRAAADMAHRASDAASRTAEAARQAASEEGLWPEGDGRTLGDKVAAVAGAALDEATASVEPVLTGEEAETESTRREGSGSV
jgi:ElaB/YqjD/DUF883 family membrane-anchored ribosome-binding protein